MHTGSYIQRMFKPYVKCVAECGAFLAHFVYPTIHELSPVNIALWSRLQTFILTAKPNYIAKPRTICFQYFNMYLSVVKGLKYTKTCISSPTPTSFVYHIDKTSSPALLFMVCGKLRRLMRKFGIVSTAFKIASISPRDAVTQWALISLRIFVLFCPKHIFCPCLTLPGVR